MLVLPLDLSKPKSFNEAVRTVLDKMGKVKSKSFKKHNIQNEQIVNVQVSCLLHNPTRWANWFLARVGWPVAIGHLSLGLWPGTIGHLATWSPDLLTSWPPDHLTTWPHDHLTTWKILRVVELCLHCDFCSPGEDLLTFWYFVRWPEAGWQDTFDDDKIMQVIVNIFENKSDYMAKRKSYFSCVLRSVAMRMNWRKMSWAVLQ